MEKAGDLTEKKFAVIGVGAMGGAFVEGLLEKAGVPEANISVSDPNPTIVTTWERRGVKVSSSNKDTVKDPDLVVIAVKPWLLSSVIEEIESEIYLSNAEVCLIVAGLSMKEIYGMFKKGVPEKLSVAIPNTAMSVGESMTFVVPVSGEPELSIKALETMGKVMKIEERLLPAATALASCGIAYALRYVRAACEGGVQLGFRASDAMKIVNQTLKGAAAILELPGRHPEAEIDKVTTPGGITIKGLNAMEHAGFTNAVIEGLLASGKW